MGNLNEYNLNLLGSGLRPDITWALICNATQGLMKILITSVGVPGHELPHGLSRGRDDAAWHAETCLEFRENSSSLPMFMVADSVFFGTLPCCLAPSPDPLVYATGSTFPLHSQTCSSSVPELALRRGLASETPGSIDDDLAIFWCHFGKVLRASFAPFIRTLRIIGVSSLRMSVGQSV